MAATATPITVEQTESFQNMWNYNNDELFSGELSPCLLNFSRKMKAYGFFAPDRWIQGMIVRPEISINPAYLSTRDPIEIVSTLVHEMVHQWQFEFGKPSRSGYHNKQWALKMEEVGLTPSMTGAPGGKKTGQRVSHFVTPGGAFEDAFFDMPKGFWFPWVCAPEDFGATGAKKRAAAKGKNKIKYVCGGCSTNVWGKGGLQIACVPCNDYFEEA